MIPFLPSSLESSYLHIGARIPVWVEQDHSVSTDEIDPHAPSSRSQQHGEHGLVGVEAVYKSLRRGFPKGQKGAT